LTLKTAPFDSADEKSATHVLLRGYSMAIQSTIGRLQGMNLMMNGARTISSAWKTDGARKRCALGLTLVLAVVGFAASAMDASGSQASGQQGAADDANAPGGTVAALQQLIDTHQVTEMRTTSNGRYGTSEMFQAEKLTYYVTLSHDKVFWRVIRTDSMTNADSIYRAFVQQTEQLSQVDIDALRLQAGNKYAEQMMAMNQQRLQNLQQDAARQQQESQQIATQQQQATQQAVTLSSDLRSTSSQLDAVKQQIRTLETQQNSPELVLPSPAAPAAPASASSSH
jgi:hypothetical protein